MPPTSPATPSIASNSSRQDGWQSAKLHVGKPVHYHQGGGKQSHHQAGKQSNQSGKSSGGKSSVLKSSGGKSSGGKPAPVAATTEAQVRVNVGFCGIQLKSGASFNKLKLQKFPVKYFDGTVGLGAFLTIMKHSKLN